MSFGDTVPAVGPTLGRASTIDIGASSPFTRREPLVLRVHAVGTITPVRLGCAAVIIIRFPVILGCGSAHTWRTRDDVAPAVSATLADIEEARTLGGQVYYPHRVALTHPGDPFCMHLDVRTFGPLTVGKLSYDAAVRIDTGPLGDGYQFNVPSSGVLRMSYVGERLVATPTLAAVHSPQRPSSIEGWGDGAKMLAVKIARPAVEETLERLLGHGLKHSLAMGPGLALDRGPGAEIWRLLKVLADQLHDVHAGGEGANAGASLFESSPFATSLAQSLITGLLYAHEHNYSDELRRPTAPGGPAAIPGCGRVHRGSRP